MAKAKKVANGNGKKNVHIALKNIHHDGELYTQGDEIELTDDQAEQLNAVGAINVTSTIDEPEQGAE